MKSRLRPFAFLNSIPRQLSALRDRLGPIPLLWGAISLGILAQHTLTPQPFLAAGSFLLMGALFLYLVIFSGQRKLQAGSYSLLLLLALTLSRNIPAETRVPLLFGLSALLFLGAIAAERKAEDAPFTRRELLILALILVLAFALLTYDLENIPPGVHGDEGETGMQALAILEGRVSNPISVGWFEQPILGFLWPAISMGIFGDTLFGLRISSVLVGVASLLFTYLLVRLLFGRGVALLAAPIMASGHWFIGLNRLGGNWTETTLLETAAIYFLFRGIRYGSKRDWTFSGICVGAGLYLYYASRLVPILIATFLLLSILQERDFWRKRAQGIAILFIAAILVFLPQGLYFLNHPEQFVSRTRTVFLLSDPVTTQHFTGTTEPIAALWVQTQRLLAFFNYGPDRGLQYGYHGPVLDFLSGVFLVLGLAYTLARVRHSHYLFLALWFSMTVGVGGILTLTSPNSPRLVGMMPAVYILIALALHLTLSHLPALSPGQDRRLFALAISAVTIGTIAYSNYQIYFVDYIHSLDGWAQQEPATAVAKYIRERRDTHEFYLLGAPRLYLRHGTIRFLARTYQGVDVENPEAFIPLPQPPLMDVSYIILPEYLEWLPALKDEYPQGQEQVFLRNDGQIWFAAYEVPQEIVLKILAERD